MTVLLKRTFSYLTMTSGTNIVLSSWLATRLPLASNVVITVQSGATIRGGNGAPALILDDLGGVKDFDSITINNYAEIQGQGGAANSGIGGNAISCTGGVIEFNNYGAIRSGGGGGQYGGWGGTGNWVNAWSPQVWDSSKYLWATWSYTETNSPAQWDDIRIGNPHGYDYVWNDYPNGAYIYTHGSTAPDPFGKFNYIKRATVVGGWGGSGGNGGRGQGCDQSVLGGSVGNLGGNGGGRGGSGGSGGGWGASGNSGARGAAGYQWNNAGDADFGGSLYNRVATARPSYTGTNARAGYSLIATGGGVINFTNNGTVNGPKSGVA